MTDARDHPIQLFQDSATDRDADDSVLRIAAKAEPGKLRFRLCIILRALAERLVGQADTPSRHTPEFRPRAGQQPVAIFSRPEAEQTQSLH